ncbi:MAG: SMC-Scp complex subunit ScpB [Firmicutes bacterium]|nr:SMC-Scp complex subunit ScpB [Bacillota bacterium]
MSSRKTIKSAIESMMLIWGEPLAAKDIADIFNIEKKEAYACCRELMEEYEQEGRGIVIREVNKAFQFTTRPENLPYIERLCTPVRRRRLSQSALETLAIVAYRQPVTKGEIEAIRGIRCDRVMEGLVKKGLVRDVGRSDAVGRPILYGTTDEFLKQFGFETIRELPDIRDIEGLLDEEGPEGEIDGILAQQISLEELAGAGKAEDAPSSDGEEPAEGGEESAEEAAPEEPASEEAPAEPAEPDEPAEETAEPTAEN